MYKLRYIDELTVKSIKDFMTEFSIPDDAIVKFQVTDKRSILEYRTIPAMEAMGKSSPLGPSVMIPEKHLLVIHHVPEKY